MRKLSGKKFVITSLFLIPILFCFSIYSQALTNIEEDLFNEYYDEAYKLLEPYMFLDDVKSNNPSTKIAKKDLHKSVELFSKALKIYPDSWQSYWFMGKAYQALYELDKTYNSFKKAYSIMPNNPDVANEYMMITIELMKNQEALTIGQESIKKFPGHLSLVANYSLVLLLNGQVEEAYSMAQKALEIKSDDPIAQNLLQLINDVKAGKRKIPKSYWALVLGIDK